MRLRKIAFASLFLCLMGIHKPAEAQVFMEASIDSLSILSKKENKPVLLYLQTDWCRWCKLMEKETFSDTVVQQLMQEEYFCARLNAEKDEEGLHIKKRFSINQFPSVIILDSGGQLIYTIEGFSPPAVFAGELKRAIGN